MAHSRRDFLRRTTCAALSAGGGPGHDFAGWGW